MAGYSFKPGILTAKQEEILDKQLASILWDEASEDTKYEEVKCKDRIYLTSFKLRSFFPLAIYDNNDDEKNDRSIGIIWAAKEKKVLELYFDAYPDNDKLVHPYRVDTNTIYYVKNGEFRHVIAEGEDVSTPKGRGIVHSIDNSGICVELNDENGILYEFEPKDLSRINDKVVNNENNK